MIHISSFDFIVLFLDTSYTTPLLNIKITIDEIWAYRHFEVPEYAEYNEKQKYFMFGDEEEAFISHVITKESDYYQVSLITKPGKLIIFV